MYTIYLNVKLHEVIQADNSLQFAWFSVMKTHFDRFWNSKPIKKHPDGQRVVWVLKTVLVAWSKLYTSENSYCGGHSQKISTKMAN